MIVAEVVRTLREFRRVVYLYYIVRSKMSEPTAAVAACKTSVSEFISAKIGRASCRERVKISGFAVSLKKKKGGSVVTSTTGQFNVKAHNTLATPSQWARAAIP